MVTTARTPELIAAAPIAEPVLRHPPRSLWSDAWRQFRRHRLAVTGLIVFVVLLLMTVFGPLLYRTSADSLDVSASLIGPTLQHPFGTDDLGHDLLARTLLGGRISMAVGVVAVLIALSLGTVIGSLAGYFGGPLDNALMRVTDMFIGLPQLPILLLVIFLFRDSLRKAFGPELGPFLMIVGVIGILNWMPLARLTRASFLSLKQKEFVEAARCLGASNRRLITSHILPNTASAIIVAATVTIGQAIITESTLSFLGLGFPPDVPTWGRLLYDSQNYLDNGLGLHWAIFPGIMIFLTVLSINYVGDGLRDALDPRKTQ